LVVFGGYFNGVFGGAAPEPVLIQVSPESEKPGKGVDKTAGDCHKEEEKSEGVRHKYLQ
jgi:hypothetical protein